MNEYSEWHRVQDGPGYVTLTLSPEPGGLSILLTAGFGFRAETCPLTPTAAAQVVRHLVDMLASFDPAAALRLVDDLVVAPHIPDGSRP
jgi:hypothetical protein